ncbi:MAG: DMT family transporter [Desulfovibrio sp.]
MQDSKNIGYGCALLATLIWSGNFIVARGLGDVIPPFTLATMRWSVATLMLLPFALGAIRKHWALIRKHSKHICLSAFLGVTVFNTFIYISAHTTDALNMTLIATTTPAFVVVLSRIFFGEPITGARAMGLVCAVGGIFTLVTRGDLAVLQALDFRVGDLYMLGASILWAAYSIIIKKKPQDIPPKAYLGVTFTLGLLPLIPAALIEQSIAPQFSFAPQVVGAFLYIGIGASLISYFLWTKAVNTIGPTKAAFIYYSLPAFCGIEAYFFLGEKITWAHGAGFVLILSGILLATHPRFNKSIR